MLGRRKNKRRVNAKCILIPMMLRLTGQRTALSMSANSKSNSIHRVRLSSSVMGLLFLSLSELSRRSSCFPRAVSVPLGRNCVQLAA